MDAILILAIVFAALATLGALAIEFGQDSRTDWADSVVSA